MLSPLEDRILWTLVSQGLWSRGILNLNIGRLTSVPFLIAQQMVIGHLLCARRRAGLWSDNSDYYRGESCTPGACNLGMEVDTK